MKTNEVTIFNNTFDLHPCGAVYWAEQNALLIADVHFGKITHFRKAGFAVPPSSIEGNFKKLDGVLEHHDPEKVIFLGDLFHSDINSEWKLFSDWICEKDFDVTLVVGNHDVIAEAEYCEANLSVVDELVVSDFLLTHKPETRDGFFNFCGHIHPCVRLRGNGRQFLKLPCFFLKRDQMILPAFGEFTGTYELSPDASDRVFAVTKNEVIEVSVQRERST